LSGRYLYPQYEKSKGFKPGNCQGNYDPIALPAEIAAPLN
jgi:hypothetical protein